MHIQSTVFKKNSDLALALAMVLLYMITPMPYKLAFANTPTIIITPAILSADIDENNIITSAAEITSCNNLYATVRVTNEAAAPIALVLAVYGNDGRLLKVGVQELTVPEFSIDYKVQVGIGGLPSLNAENIKQKTGGRFCCLS